MVRINLDFEDDWIYYTDKKVTYEYNTEVNRCVHSTAVRMS